MNRERINMFVTYCFERSLQETENPAKSMEYLKLALKWSEVNHVIQEWREWEGIE